MLMLIRFVNHAMTIVKEAAKAQTIPSVPMVVMLARAIKMDLIVLLNALL